MLSTMVVLTMINPMINPMVVQEIITTIDNGVLSAVMVKIDQSHGSTGNHDNGVLSAVMVKIMYLSFFWF
jgi:hypothetical protein